MKNLILLSAVFFALNCYADSVPYQYAEELFSRVDSYCSGNDNGGTSHFDIKKFDAATEKGELLARDRSCKGMKASRSKEEGIGALVAYFNNSDDSFSGCIVENFTDEEQNIMLSVIKDPTNLGVFSNQYDNKDESEACYFHHFAIYRADGLKILIVHDETD